MLRQVGVSFLKILRILVPPRTANAQLPFGSLLRCVTCKCNTSPLLLPIFGAHLGRLLRNPVESYAIPISCLNRLRLTASGPALMPMAATLGHCRLPHSHHPKPLVGRSGRVWLSASSLDWPQELCEHVLHSILPSVHVRTYGGRLRRECSQDFQRCRGPQS